MKQVRLSDGTQVFCLARPEALALDSHVDGYFRHGVDVRPGDVVFDVGANIGLFGVRIAQRTQGQARVVAFEPVPPIRAVLEANVARHGRGVTAMPCALARQPGAMEISYYPRSPALSTGHPGIWGDDHERLAEAVLGDTRARLLPRPVARWIAGFLRGAAQRFPCPVRTVPEVRRELGAEKIDLLKIDVEGAELDVLLGLGDDASEWKRVRSLVIEVHDVEGRVETIRALLTRHGFDRIAVEAEAGFEKTVLRNVYATRA